MSFILIFAGAAHENRIRDKKDARGFNNPAEAPHDFLTGFDRFDCDGRPLKILCYDPAYPISITKDDIEYTRAVLPKLSFICDLNHDKVIVFNFGYAEAQHFPTQYNEPPVVYTWVDLRGRSSPDLDLLQNLGPNMGLNTVQKIRDYSFRAKQAGLVQELLFPIQEARPFLSRLIYFPTETENFDLLFDFFEQMQKGDSDIHRTCQRLKEPVRNKETWYASEWVQDRKLLKAYIFADAL